MQFIFKMSSKTIYALSPGKYFEISLWGTISSVTFRQRDFQMASMILFFLLHDFLQLAAQQDAVQECLPKPTGMSLTGKGCLLPSDMRGKFRNKWQDAFSLNAICEL